METSRQIIEKGEFYEMRHRIKCFKDEIVEEIDLKYFTLLSDESDWIKDNDKLKTWCDKYGVKDYHDGNAFTNALRQNGWVCFDHYYVIMGNIKLRIK